MQREQLYQIRATGKIVSITVSRGLLERRSVYASVDDEVEALNWRDAYNELKGRIVAKFHKRFGYFDEEDYEQISWEVEPTVKPTPETVLMLRRGEPTLFPMDSV